MTTQANDLTPIAIDVRGVFKTFREKPVLTGVDLQVRTAETLCIIGRSGCGKSVLLKHIIGLMKPDQGSITVENQVVSEMTAKTVNAVRRKFGMVFQAAALFDSMTVGENVGFYLLEYSDLKRSEIEDIVEAKLRMVGLENISHLKPAELSGGMRKRVGIARAIAHDPLFILYDEPTAGLDPIMSDVINELIIKLDEQLDVTSVVVTHDMTSAYKISDRVAMMYGGKIIALGTPEDINGTDDPYVRQFITGQSTGPIDVIGGA